LAALIGCAYVNALPGAFVYDDVRFISENPGVHSIQNIGRFFASFEGTGGSREIYRPFRSASFALSWALWRGRAWGFHLENIALHLANALMWAAVARALGAGRLGQTAAGAVFALHPVQTEAVTWISSRADLQFMFFYLAAFYVYVKRRAPTFGRLACVAILYCLALLCKESAASLPILVAAWDLADGRVREPRGLRRHVAAWGVLILLTVAYAATRFFVSGQVVQRGMWGGGVAPTCWTMARMFARYLGLTLLPANLSADWRLLVSQSVADFRVLASLVLCVAYVIGIAAARRHRLACLGLSWFAIALIPVSNLLPLKALIADRFLYPSVCGAALALVATLQSTARNSRTKLALVGALMLCFIALTIDRNHDWRDEPTLWRYTARACPASYNAWHGLANDRLRTGAFRVARRHAQRLTQIDLREADGYEMLGRTCLALGDPRRAAAALSEAARLDPRSPFAYLELGNATYAARDYRRAEEAYREAAELDPMMATAQVNLGHALLMQGKADEAADAYRAALRREGADASVLNDLGRALLRAGRARDAVGVFRQLTRTAPRFLMGRYNLAEALAASGDTAAAAAEFQHFIRVWRGSPDGAARAKRRLRQLKSADSTGDGR